MNKQGFILIGIILLILVGIWFWGNLVGSNKGYQKGYTASEIKHAGDYDVGYNKAKEQFGSVTTGVDAVVYGQGIPQIQTIYIEKPVSIDTTKTIIDTLRTLKQGYVHTIAESQWGKKLLILKQDIRIVPDSVIVYQVRYITIPPKEITITKIETKKDWIFTGIGYGLGIVSGWYANDKLKK